MVDVGRGTKCGLVAVNVDVLLWTFWVICDPFVIDRRSAISTKRVWRSFEGEMWADVEHELNELEMSVLGAGELYLDVWRVR